MAPLGIGFVPLGVIDYRGLVMSDVPAVEARARAVIMGQAVGTMTLY